MSDIVIYGRGKTGQSLSRMLNRQGKSGVFYDDTQGFDIGGSFDKNTLVFLSPGVKPLSNGINMAKKAGATLTSELEYCFKYLQAKCVSVTGTNGKTTTCEMIRHLLKKSGVACRLLGNGGIPLSEEVLDIAPDEIVVLESSSFQLTDAKTFAPYISVFTSLACDHLDYHGSFEEYVQAKVNNFLHQSNGYAIFNADDENVVEISNLCKCRKLYYSTQNPSADCYFDGQSVIVSFDGQQAKEECSILNKYAKHNLSNALSAILAAYLLNVPLNSILANITDYRLLPHRLEVVATINGVTFVDDSKATNVHATINAMQNYTLPLALILGGSNKGEKFDEIFLRLPHNTVTVAASGDTAKLIAECGNTYGVEVATFDDIGAATKYCYQKLRRCGGVVLMSNACASFDKFSGYAERGEYFHQVVKGLSGGKKTN